MANDNHSDGPRSRVAVVDDERDIGDIIRRGLKRRYEIDIFVSADEIYESLSQGTDYDVIICDLQLPYITGREIYDEIESRWPQQAQRVIFMSGVSARGARDDYLKGLDRPMLKKPFRLEELRRLVDEVAASH